MRQLDHGLAGSGQATYLLGVDWITFVVLMVLVLFWSWAATVIGRALDGIDERLAALDTRLDEMQGRLEELCEERLATNF